MIQSARLGKLEESATERWRRAWEAYFKILSPHVRDLIDQVTQACDEAERLNILGTDEECGSTLDMFRDRLGLPAWTTIWGWGSAEDEFDLDCPDLTRWPHSELEAPPPEPPDAWEQVELYRQSPDVTERFCALMILFTLAQARGHRSYLKRGP